MHLATFICSGPRRSRRPTLRFPALALLLLALIGARPASAQDRVVLVTGVELEGEIKSASRGTLSFDNDELDVVKVDLVDVRALTSPSFFEVTDANGGVYRGSLEAADSGMVRIGGANGPAVVPLGSIVEILQFDATFWGRTSGFVDVGVNLTQANDLRSLSIGSRLAYRGPRWGWVASEDAYWQTQTTTIDTGEEFAEATRRISINGAVSRYFARWAVQGSADWERNDELDLESRFQFGAQGIYTLIENQALELKTGGGLVNNTEDYVDSDRQTTVEVIVGAGVDIFDLGDVDVYTRLQTYTNLNEDRFRLSLDGRISWEVIDDFYLGLNVKENYDSSPPSAASAKRDFRYGFSIGWSWS
ncbi:MAG TPA: DUF481 domain-containing protein [Longimicrobiales bacterium]|nr:DUF481 domain-containing protein [Longimicrobiales bacterium]